MLSDKVVMLTRDVMFTCPASVVYAHHSFKRIFEQPNYSREFHMTSMTPYPSNSTITMTIVTLFLYDVTIYYSDK
jgi:hypothetical protein